jgi:hypothetical protein
MTIKGHMASSSTIDFVKKFALKFIRVVSERVTGNWVASDSHDTRRPRFQEAPSYLSLY